MINFLDLKNINKRYRKELIKSFKEVLDSGWFILGDHVKKFEKEFADYCGVKNCIGVANGLDALELILEGYKQLGFIRNGDEVLVASNAYIACILAISNAGLTPVLIEPNIDTYLIDQNQIEKKYIKKRRQFLRLTCMEDFVTCPQ